VHAERGRSAKGDKPQDCGQRDGLLYRKSHPACGAAHDAAVKCDSVRPAFEHLLQLRALNNCVPCMQREDAVQKLTELKVVGRIMDYLTEGLSLHVELLMMLLSNVTVSDPACEQLLQLKTRSVTGFNM